MPNLALAPGDGWPPRSAQDRTLWTTTGNMWRMKDARGPLAEVDQLQSTLSSMPAREQSVFALACAERLVTAARASRDDLYEALAVAWPVALGGSGDCVNLRSKVEGREDLDNDDVAAVAFALGSVIGNPGDAWSAGSRAIDAAFERIPIPPGPQPAGLWQRTWPASRYKQNCGGKGRLWSG
jgi:hypothetical protein